MGLFKKSGGGYLNGVEGTIVGVKFGTKEFVSKKTKQPYETISAELLVQLDGADEPVQQFLPAGFFYPDSMLLSDDGTTIYGVNEDGEQVDLEESWLRDDTEFAKFVASVIAAGVAEDVFGLGASFEPLVGLRVRFKRVIDEEATKQFGTRKSKDGKKEYKRDYLLVETVLGQAEAAPAKGGKKTTKAAAATKTTAAKTTTKKTAAPDTSRADEVIQSLVADAKDNVVSRKQIGSVFVRYAMANKLSQEDRKAIQAQITDEAYLTDAAERGIISYDGTDKAQPIGIAG